MKKSELFESLENFKVEELEPRLEMGKWSAKAGSTQNYQTGAVTTYQEVSWSSN